MGAQFPCTAILLGGKLNHERNEKSGNGQVAAGSTANPVRHVRDRRRHLRRVQVPLVSHLPALARSPYSRYAVRSSRGEGMTLTCLIGSREYRRLLDAGWQMVNLSTYGVATMARKEKTS